MSDTSHKTPRWTPPHTLAEATGSESAAKVLADPVDFLHALARYGDVYGSQDSAERLREIADEFVALRRKYTQEVAKRDVEIDRLTRDREHWTKLAVEAAERRIAESKRADIAERHHAAARKDATSWADQCAEVQVALVREKERADAAEARVREVERERDEAAAERSEAHDRLFREGWTYNPGVVTEWKPPVNEAAAKVWAEYAEFVREARRHAPVIKVALDYLLPSYDRGDGGYDEINAALAWIRGLGKEGEK